jgi:hypothetical protein
MPAIYLLLSIAGLVAALYFGAQLYDKIYSDAMAASRVEIARELIASSSHFSRHRDVVVALDIVAEQILRGELVDGVEVQRLIEGQK